MRCLPSICTLFFFMPSTAQAEQQDGLSLSIGSDLRQFDYREYSNQGRLLDREHGFLPGLLLGANRSYGEWRLAGQVSYHAGGVTYTGQTNTGVPLTTTTNQRMVNPELRAERRLDELSHVHPAVYLGAAHQVWRRDIQPSYTADGQPVQGLLEIYRWWQVFFGAKARVYESAGLVWDVDARAIRLLVPKIVVDYAGRYDNPHLSLGERWGFRLAAPLCFKVRPSTRIAIEPYLQKFSFGRSALTPLTSQGLPAGAVYEPDSDTRSYGLSVVVSERF